jgi:hypothetical protein
VLRDYDFEPVRINSEIRLRNFPFDADRRPGHEPGSAFVMADVRVEKRASAAEPNLDRRHQRQPVRTGKPVNRRSISPLTPRSPRHGRGAGLAPASLSGSQPVPYSSRLFASPASADTLRVPGRASA